jgi:hypothetical protein
VFIPSWDDTQKQNIRQENVPVEILGIRMRGGFRKQNLTTNTRYGILTLGEDTCQRND